MSRREIPGAWSRWLDASLAELRERHLLRELRPLVPRSAVRAELDGRPVVLFSGNDYLGLSAHPDVREALTEAADRVGSGPRGSPLVCGFTDRHRELEREIAALKGSEDALLFPTGFAANLAALGALAGSEDTTIFSDALNHASIVDGCRLARQRGADLEVYPHLDVETLDRLLEASDAERKLVVTESLFSVDGDRAPLERLVEVKDRHGALLVVDEAHATLVFGETGGGLAEELGVAGRIEVQIGTLSKAAGALGGFAATSGRIRRWLLNRGRSLVFSTAPPLPVVEAARRAIRIGREDDSLRRRLWNGVARLGDRLGRELRSPIVPVVLGDEEAALRADRTLLEHGYHVVAIRPPTVPPGTARLRVTLSAAHRPSEIDGLASALRPFL